MISWLSKIEMLVFFSSALEKEKKLGKNSVLIDCLIDWLINIRLMG